MLAQGAPVYMKSWHLAIYPQTAKLFQRNEFHLVTAKVFLLESFAVYGKSVMIMSA